MAHRRREVRLGKSFSAPSRRRLPVKRTPAAPLADHAGLEAAERLVPTGVWSVQSPDCPGHGQRVEAVANPGNLTVLRGWPHISIDRVLGGCSVGPNGSPCPRSAPGQPPWVPDRSWVQRTLGARPMTPAPTGRWLSREPRSRSGPVGHPSGLEPPTWQNARLRVVKGRRRVSATAKADHRAVDQGRAARIAVGWGGHRCLRRPRPTTRARSALEPKVGTPNEARRG
jgi:hypothetical protein